MTLFREALGTILRDLRLEQGLSLRQLAGQAGMSATYLGEVERGLKEPSSEKLEQLAGALEVSLAELLYRVADDLKEAPSAGEDDAAVVARLLRRLGPDDVRTLARFGEFLLERRGAI